MTSFKFRNLLKRVFARKAGQPRVSPFHAVEISCTSSACQAAQDSHGKRYLSAEAPALPLGRCDRPEQCKCRYRHHEDRRADLRRRADSGLPTQHNADHVERRKVRGRRAEDLADDGKPCSVSEDSYYEFVGDRIHERLADAGESAGVDPYNTGSFDKSKS